MTHIKEKTGNLTLAGLFILYLAAGTVFNVVVPLGDAPDEPAHFAYVRHVALTWKLPVLQPKAKNNTTVEAFQAPVYYVLAAGLTHPWMQGQVHLRHNPAFDFGKQLPAYLPQAEHAFPWQGVYLAWHLTRFFSLALGAISLWSTYRIGQLVFEQQWLAIAAVAYLALNPQFIYLHSMVTNDVLATTAGALLVWTTISLLKHATIPRVLGVACAMCLTALSKPSALTLAAGSGIVALIAWRKLPSSRSRLAAMGILILVPLLGSGWWFWRNYQLYGDILGLTNLRIIAAANYYPQPLTLKQYTALLPKMFWKTFESSWGKFGWLAIPLSHGTFICILAAHIVALVGLCIRVIKHASWRWQTVVLILSWLASIGGFLYYNRITNASGWQGRFLFPSLSITAVGFIAGWQYWFRHRNARLTTAALVSGGALVFYALAAVVLPMYLPPRFLPDTVTIANPTNVEFATGLHLVGYEIKSGRVRPGGNQHLTLYWKISQPIQENYRFSVDSYTSLGDPIIHKIDSVLTGRYPLDYWPTNQIVADSYTLPIDSEANQMAGTLGVQVYSGYKDGKRTIPFIDDDGNSIGNRVEIGRIVSSKRGNILWRDAEAWAEFGSSEITLMDYELLPATPKSGETFSVTLRWRATETIPIDYQVFIHLLDDEGNLVAQQDSPPSEGRYPTSAWATNEIIVDTHPISLPVTEASRLQLCVGLYALNSLERLPATDSRPSVCSEHSVPLEAIEIGNSNY